MSIVSSGRTRPVRVQARLPLLLLFSVIGLLLVWWGGYEAAHAAGLVGTPGTLRVQACGVLVQNQGAADGCTGVFRSLDGRVTDAAAAVPTPQKLAAGSTLDIVRNGPGDYSRISLQHTVGWFALLLFGAVLACATPNTLLARRAEGSPRAARAAGLLGFAIMALFVGAAVFGVMSLVLSFTAS